MALNIWTQQTGYNFGVRAERETVDILLPVDFTDIPTPEDISFTVISGKLPPGLRLDRNVIVGTPYEVSRFTEFKFVVRAAYHGEISDRTFLIAITGADDPIWVTPSGALPVGPNEVLYVLDSTYIDFTLEARDFDTAAGQTLTFTILDQDGELPPGLILTPQGRITGFIQPLLAIPVEVDNGNYDTSLFDFIGFDFGFRPSNGFDRWTYDNATYDLATQTLLPTKLNRNYGFTVTISDGDSYVKRTFRIYVVGEDHFRADSEVNKVGEGTFTADSTYVKAPIWTTPNYLGYKRADNFHVFRLDIYEDPSATGPTVYTLNLVNPEVLGIAYTVSNLENKINTNQIRLKSVKGVPKVGDKIELSRWVKGALSTVYNIKEVLFTNALTSEYLLTLGSGTSDHNLEITIPNDTYIYLGSESKLPEGMQFDTGTGEVIGIIPYIPSVITTYTFTVTATRLSDTEETAYTDRIFTIDIVGVGAEDSVTWLSNSNLGEIEAELVSSLFIKASSTIANSKLLYTIVDGKLPPGLSLSLDGEIVGVVNQFKMSYYSTGLTSFDTDADYISDFSLDSGNTTIDRTFTFTVKVTDPMNFVESTKTFTLKVTTPNDVSYSNLVVRPFLKPSTRSAFKTFITDSGIFDAKNIYRLNDPNFGVQTELKMLAYAGIETKTAAEIVSAIGKNHKPKKFKMGDLKVAQAKAPGTNDVIYEVIYIDAIDPLEIGKKNLPERITYDYNNAKDITVDQSNQFYNISEYNVYTPYWRRADPYLVTIDNDDAFIMDPKNLVKFPSSVALWRKRIETIGLHDRHYLPLWMKTIQDGSVQELGFVKAIPLCYCKPGASAEVLAAIKNSGFDFKLLDYTVDRYIINRVKNENNIGIYNYSKYIAFENNRTTI